MFKAIKYLLIITVILSSCNKADQSDLTTFVDPFIGTDGHGHTYPGVSVPTGMVQLSPDTRTVNWDACSGYHNSDSTIIGFSHTHLSGTGAIDYGDILIMPTTGDPILQAGDEEDPTKGYRSSFNHNTEIAEPGYYSVLLDDYNIRVDLTTTERSGFHKYTFNNSGKSNIIIDLKHDLGANRILSSGIEIISNTEIEGWRQTQGWANNQNVFFVAQFSKPFINSGISLNDEVIPDINKADGENIKAFFTYDMNSGDEILIKVGISAVSIEGARENLNKENPEWDFNKIRKQAKEKWNTILKKIKIETNSIVDKRVFYTALYHSFLAPNLYNDVNGNYRGMDQKIHHSDRNIYTVFSLWDTFRATHPLFTILDPDFAGDLVHTMLTKYDESGLLPVWELGACETGCMIGYHSIPVIADAIIKGINDFDVKKAYMAMKKSAMEDHLGLEFYKAQGFIPIDKEHEAVSKTLEYAYDDWCIAQVALTLGYDDDYKYFINRSQFYKNIFDDETGFMRGKKNGQFVTPFDPAEVSGDYTEANAWQYSYFVPHDIEGLKTLVGGDKKFIESLDNLFSAEESISGRQQPDISGMIGQYAHGNEPSHHMAYLYNYAGAPYRTQEIINQIRQELYSDKRDGLCGNEDCGQMSSWYVFSALGFYPVTPGMDYYVIGTPMFENAEISVSDGNIFKIKAQNISAQNTYIQSIKLNGEPYRKLFIQHSDIMNGGSLVFIMGDEPNLDIATKPISKIEDNTFVSVPVILYGDKIFKDRTTVTIELTNSIYTYYTLDGSTPDENTTKYISPILVDKSLELKAICIDKAGNKSMIISCNYTLIPQGLSMKLENAYSHIYTAGGELALIDRQRGDTDFRSGEWQGWQGIDLDAIVDLGSIKPINYLGISCLQDQDKWIFYPSSVEFMVSNDGISFSQIAIILNSEPTDNPGVSIQEFNKTFKNIKARYIHVLAKSQGECPAWHRGAGGKTWIFADEIIIN